MSIVTHWSAVWTKWHKIINRKYRGFDKFQPLNICLDFQKHHSQTRTLKFQRWWVQFRRAFAPLYDQRLEKILSYSLLLVKICFANSVHAHRLSWVILVPTRASQAWISIYSRLPIRIFWRAARNSLINGSPLRQASESVVFFVFGKWRNEISGESW